MASAQAAVTEFKWGKKRAVGSRKKLVQFYETFTLHGVDYALYDPVYMFCEGDVDPHIGVLIKAWEDDESSKKVKVLWFFRPSEISNFIGSEKIVDNELLLACGEGVGLANINPLEAIAGKCNVVCNLKGSKISLPSGKNNGLEELNFVFYRAFDVGRCVIVNEMDDKIAGIDVNILLSRIGSQESCAVPKLDSNMGTIEAVEIDDDPIKNPRLEIENNINATNFAIQTRCLSNKIYNVQNGSDKVILSSKIEDSVIGETVDAWFLKSSCKHDLEKNPQSNGTKDEYEQGRVVLLLNLDPSFSGIEVEDIIRTAFNLSCSARMISQTSYSTSYFGQAFVIFTTRQAAQTVVQRLTQDCLMLPNGRPLVGLFATPNVPKTPTTLCGHFGIDKPKNQIQREMKEALFTSHCSQPNTIEYDMAREWCVMHERSNQEWTSLCKLQWKEFRNLKAKLNSK